MKIQYAVVEDGTKPEDVSDENKISLEGKYSCVDSPEHIAKECGKDYNSKCDGWKNHDSLTFILYLEDEFLSRLKVLREPSVNYSAFEIEDLFGSKLCI